MIKRKRTTLILTTQAFMKCCRNVSWGTEKRKKEGWREET